MNFSDLFENIKEQIESLDKKFLLILSSLVLIIIVSLILIIVLLSNNKKNEKTEQFPLVLQEELVIPPSAELPKDYNISRKTEENGQRKKLTNGLQFHLTVKLKIFLKQMKK